MNNTPVKKKLKLYWKWLRKLRLENLYPKTTKNNEQTPAK
jgi:hypothetical protein